MIPRPRAEGGVSDDRSAAASDGMTCSPIPMPCRSLAVVRSLLLSDSQAGVVIAMCAVFVSFGSLTHSVRRFARLCLSCLFSSLLLLSACSSRRACRVALRRNDAWSPEMRAIWLGCAMGGLMMRCVWRGVWRGVGAGRGSRRFCQLDLVVPVLPSAGVGSSGALDLLYRGIRYHAG